MWITRQFLGSVEVLALNWQRSETYLQHLGRYIGGTHLPNLDIMNVGITEPGIPETKQEIDKQDPRLQRQTRALACARLGFTWLQLVS